MRKFNKPSRILAAALACLMLLPLASCKSGSTSATANSGAGTASSSASNTVVTLTMLTLNGESSDSKTNRIDEAMTKATGVKLKIEAVDEDKLSVLLAGGDLPDIVRVATSKFKQLIEGGNVIALDNLMATYGKDILKNIPTTVNFSKKYWSDGKNQTYFLPVQVGTDDAAADQALGLVIRWDYYKELGYPAVNSIDDYLNVLAEMQAKHPKTAAGKKVYGVSAFTDWGNWQYIYPMAATLGETGTASSTEMIKADTNEIINILQDTSSVYWACVDYYYKANKLGILDPDALTQKFDDFSAKATAGQLLSGPATWAMGDFNSDNASKNKAVGFEVLPVEWGGVWAGTDCKAGWTDKCFAISSKCQYPEKAMKLLNYLYSYDGCRTLYSGIEGTDWTKESGITESTLKLYKKGGDAWEETGIPFDDNSIGLSHFTKDPDDNRTLDLYDDPSAFSSLLTPLQKDFCKHYNVSYPNEYFKNMISSGKTKNQANLNTLAVALMPTASSIIKRKDAKLTDLCEKYAAKMILASSDSQYQSLKQEAMKAFESAGLADVSKWYSDAWNTCVSQSKAVS